MMGAAGLSVNPPLAFFPDPAILPPMPAPSPARMPDLYEKQLAAYRKRRQKALRLREQGKTFDQIAAAIGCSRQRAERLVAKAKLEAASA